MTTRPALAYRSVPRVCISGASALLAWRLETRQQVCGFRGGSYLISNSPLADGEESGHDRTGEHQTEPFSTIPATAIRGPMSTHSPDMARVLAPKAGVWHGQNNFPARRWGNLSFRLDSGPTSPDSGSPERIAQVGLWAATHTTPPRLHPPEEC